MGNATRAKNIPENILEEETMDPVTIEDYKDLLDEEKKISAELGELNEKLREENGRLEVKIQSLEAERDGARDKALEDAAAVADEWEAKAYGNESYKAGREHAAHGIALRIRSLKACP